MSALPSFHAGYSCIDQSSLPPSSSYCNPNKPDPGYKCDVSQSVAVNPQAAALLKWRGGAGYGPLASWVGSDFCTYGWSGVSCNSAGQVVALSLPSAGLPYSGVMDWAALAQLPALTKLQLTVSAHSSALECSGRKASGY